MVPVKRLISGCAEGITKHDQDQRSKPPGGKVDIIDRKTAAILYPGSPRLPNAVFGPSFNVKHSSLPGKDSVPKPEKIAFST
jgi:hypothetical protein